MINKTLETIEATQQLAQQLVDLSTKSCVFYLQGELGAGKTTFAQYFIRHCGYQEKIKSPSFSLLEHYETAQGELCHIDCYRIHEPEELEYIGLRDYQDRPIRWLIEWPEQGEGHLPTADITLQFTRHDGKHAVSLHAHSAEGETLLNALTSSLLD